ncbi:efflux RND transporter periplasmic adaptor subunit [Beijerinckia sp. L45]|uniref:efflux RND transporter periplasmic adaptor subunit n=1 Tax=Beijerinckia sp. L45 TaxID=1641855 RepID=UPI00131D63B7|nr:efflux RND transporter periplasmic adaptor subunit [Beijerinckia sp. L45]
MLAFAPSTSSAATATPLAAVAGTGTVDPKDGRPPAPADNHPDTVVRLSPDQASTQGITTVRVTSGTLSRHLVVPGTIAIDTDRVARVPARVVGTVSAMRKRLGDPVAAGEVVAILDSREVADAKSEYLTASVNFDLQKTLFDRAKTLWDRRVSAEQQFLQVQNTFAETSLRFELARQKLSALGIEADAVKAADRLYAAGKGLSTLRLYEVRSPLAGRIVERKVDVGTAVGKEGDPAEIYTVADLSTVWLDLSVPTVDLASVNEGAAVGIPDPSGGPPIQGRITFISPILNQDTRSVRVIAEVPNAALRLRPGMFASAEVSIASAASRIVAPRAAVQTISGEKAVFVQTPDGFQRRDVKIGAEDDEAFEILSGLSDGDVVASRNSFLLKAELGKGGADSE